MDGNRRNVLFVLPSLGFGGAERQVIDLVNGISKDKFNVFLLTFEKDLDQLEKVDREKVKFFNYQRKSKYDLAVTKRIAEIIDSKDIDIVHWTNQIALLYGLVGKWRAKKKVKFIGAIHTTVNRNLKMELYDWFLYVPLMTFCKSIITVCDNQRKHWSRKYPWLRRKFVTVHNGIDTERYKDTFPEIEKESLKESLGIKPDEFTFAILSAFRPEKGHEYAFHALKVLIDQGKRIKLLLIGDGERKTFLQSLSEKLSLSPTIIWAGFQKDPRSYMSICDVFLIPSYAVETFSIAILESLSMGKPVIATHIGGASEVIQDGINGFLIRPKEVESIIQNLLKLAEDADLRGALGRNARESVTEKYRVTDMVQKTEALLVDLV